MNFHATKISIGMISEAEKRIAAAPDYKKNIMGRVAYERGFIGELVFEKWMHANNISYEPRHTTGFDYLVRGMEVEVKTKSRASKPSLEYMASVPEYNHEHQKADLFIFVSLVESKKTDKIDRFVSAYILGGSTYSMIGWHGRIKKKGVVSKSNGMVAKMNTYDVKIKKLINCDNLLRGIR